MLDVKKQRLNVAREEVKFDLLTKNVSFEIRLFKMVHLVRIFVHCHKFSKKRFFSVVGNLMRKD